MGNILMQSLVVMCNAMEGAENVQQSGGQFPFLAALILVAIILVVSVGDMVAVNKDGEEDSTSNQKNENSNSQM
ncbi:MAG: hypothetical protein J6F30_12615 [Cellulosilyticum sp.]|nr:hypothetical protein [Cellulosilyticum sp.]